MVCPARRRRAPYYGCYFWNRRHASPTGCVRPPRRLPAPASRGAPPTMNMGRCAAACSSDKVLGHPRPAGLIIAFATPASLRQALFLAPKSPHVSIHIRPAFVWRCMAMADAGPPAKQQKEHALRDRRDISDGKGFNRTGSASGSKHLQTLRAVKTRNKRKGPSLAFVGILCALLPILTAAVTLWVCVIATAT